MKKKIYIIITLICSYYCFATDYYVSNFNGSDSNNGLSESTAFKTIQRAANITNPGDTVYVMDGEYNNTCSDCNVVTIKRSGTSSNWILYTNYPNHKPLIKFNGWQGIQVKDGASYVKINGFIIQGNSDNLNLSDALNQPGSCNNSSGGIISTYNGNGIQMAGLSSFSTGYPHHIEITNNEIFDSPGAGISCLKSDYLTIKNNKIHDNGWYTVFGTSGITMYQNWNYNSDINNYRMIIENNYLSGNKNLVPWVVVCDITDGNGIIVDDARNTQNGSNIGAYKGKTLIRNNIIIGSGGPAVHIYLSDNVDIINNSTYYNQQTPQILNGEIDAIESSNVTIRNNIMYAKSDKPINNIINSTNITIDHNLLYGGNGTMVLGSNSIINNPNYLNPSLSLSADFTVNSSSPSVDKGSSILAPSTDFNGNTRPKGNGFDIGAYEYNSSLSVDDFEKTHFIIYPNPVTDILKIKGDNIINSYKVIDLTGKILIRGVENNISTIDLSPLKKGLYVLEINTGNETTTLEKVYKN